MTLGGRSWSRLIHPGYAGSDKFNRAAGLKGHAWVSDSITLDAATILTIEGVTKAQLQASDFVF